MKKCYSSEPKNFKMLAGVGLSTALLEPLADEIGRVILCKNALFADDTPVKMRAPRQKKTKTVRVWTGSGGFSVAWNSRLSWARARYVWAPSFRRELHNKAANRIDVGFQSAWSNRKAIKEYPNDWAGSRPSPRLRGFKANRAKAAIRREAERMNAAFAPMAGKSP